MNTGTLIYTAAPNGPISNEDVAAYGPVLRQIEQQSGRRLKPGEVVELARHTRSPLHRFFDWNDASAAHKHRLWRARQLISHVRVVVLDDKGRRRPERLFFNVRLEDDEKSEKVYVAVDRVMEDSGLRSQVIAQALREFRALGEKYRRYRELDDIRIVVARIRAQFKGKTKRGRRKVRA